MSNFNSYTFGCFVSFEYFKANQIRRLHDISLGNTSFLMRTFENYNHQGAWAKNGCHFRVLIRVGFYAAKADKYRVQYLLRNSVYAYFLFGMKALLYLYFLVQHCLLQWFSYISIHQNHMERLLKHKLLGLTWIPDFVGFGCGPIIYISNKFHGDADTAGVRTTPFKKYWWGGGEW